MYVTYIGDKILILVFEELWIWGIVGSYIPFLFVTWDYFIIILFLEAKKGKLLIIENLCEERMVIWKAKNVGIDGLPQGMSFLVGFVDLCSLFIHMSKTYTSNSISVRENFIKYKQNYFEL